MAAARGPAGEGANLFAIDAAAVARLVAEANAGLAARVRALLAGLERMPVPLVDDDQLRRATRFAAQLREALAETRRAKMADKAPFGTATKAIDGFFEELNRPLDRALRAVEAALTEAHAQATPAPAATPGAPAPTPAAAPPALRELTTVWQAGRIDRAALDLDALRPHFTDTELDRAVARWLAANGPQPLAGASWRQAVTTRGG